jgi:hypothetical protein
VDPADFYYLLLEHADADTSVMNPFAATRHEIILGQYAHFVDEQQSRKQVNTFLGVLETSLGLLSSASAFVTTENPAYIVDAVINTAGSAGQTIVQHQAMEAGMRDVYEEKQVVEKEIFRKGSIPPGKVLSGFVFFPVFHDPGHVMFCFPLEHQLFQFVYRQE